MEHFLWNSIISMLDILSIWCEIFHRWMPLVPTDVWSTLIHLKAWHREAVSYYLTNDDQVLWRHIVSPGHNGITKRQREAVLVQACLSKETQWVHRLPSSLFPLSHQGTHAHIVIWKTLLILELASWLLMAWFPSNCCVNIRRSVLGVTLAKSIQSNSETCFGFVGLVPVIVMRIRIQTRNRIQWQ